MTTIAETNWDKLTADWNAWWAGELDRPLIWIQSRGKQRWLSNNTNMFIPSHMDELSMEEILQLVGDDLDNMHCHGDAVPCWWPQFGAGAVAAFLGATLRARPETVWFEPANGSDTNPISELTLSRDDDNIWWQRVQAYTREALDRWGQDIAIGHADLGGNLDILSSFRTAQNLLFDLVDSPEEVDRLVGGITQLWLTYYKDLLAIAHEGPHGHVIWAPLWLPEGRSSYMLQSDFSYMISPQMFERFVLPDLEACCVEMTDAFYHLDGKGELPHLDMLLSMKNLRGVQWVAGDGQPPPSTWFELQNRILNAGKRGQTWATREEAMTLFDNLDGGGKGMMVLIVDCDTAAKAEDFLADVNRRFGL